MKVQIIIVSSTCTCHAHIIIGIECKNIIAGISTRTKLLPACYCGWLLLTQHSWSVKTFFLIESISLLPDISESYLLPSLPVPLLQGPGVPPDPPLPAPPHQCVHVCQCVLCDSPGCGEVSTYCQASSKQ